MNPDRASDTATLIARCTLLATRDPRRSPLVSPDAGAALLKWLLFAVAIADYGLTMRSWAGAALASRRPWRHWMIAAVVLSIVAAGVPQRHWNPSAIFNANDLYHVIQGLAIACFYRAGLTFGIGRINHA